MSKVAPAPALKRRKLSPAVEGSDSGDDHSAISEGLSGSSAAGGSSDAEEPDTEDEIAQMKQLKSKKTLKRKRRATDPSNFGAALQTLLSTDAPTELPLSLRPSVARKRNDEKLETRARRALQGERKEKEESRHVTDVIGGWGAESERALRKVAQRGVVKLFNAIQQSQAASAEAQEQAKAKRGSGKPSLPAPDVGTKQKGKKGKQKDNLIGRGKQANVDKDGFLDMIRSGGVVSKS